MTNKLKEMFVLNWLSNVNSNYVAVREDELNKNLLQINKVLKDPVVQNMSGGKWDMVWGPAAGNSESLRNYKPIIGRAKKIKRWVTDNAMYVAQKAGTNEYFIGISGTNGVSLKGWFDQDFDVEESVPWPLKSLGTSSVETKGKPRISKAGKTGIEALWNLKPLASAKESGTQLIDFLLEKVKEQECTISIGGHSLGGCLTAILAAAISDKIAERPELYSGVKINAYPTAGPTPGNRDFANHLAENINEYHAVYNENDLVPLSWDFEKLDQLKKNYGKWEFGTRMIRPNKPVNANLLHWASNFAKEQGYVRKPSIDSPNFHVSTWQNNLIKTVKIKGKETGGHSLNAVIWSGAHVLTVKKSPVKPQLLRITKGKGNERENAAILLRFLMQVLSQHVTAYLSPSASTGVPWSFADTEKKALGQLFLDRQTSRDKKEKEATKQWGVATGLVLLAELLKLAADWWDKKDHDAMELDEFDDGVGLEEMTEEDLNRYMENVIEDANSDDGDAVLGNPYSPS